MNHISNVVVHLKTRSGNVNITIMTACWVLQFKTLLLLGRNCNKQACWFGAVVTTITAVLVWRKCNRQHRWLDIEILELVRYKYIRHA